MSSQASVDLHQENALREAATALLAWYDHAARRLPWRDEPTPYRVWISEIMLQQTRVEAVMPYFQRFMDALPDVGTLAAVSQERLFKLWEGLGYYRRAANLKNAAAVIMQEFGGELPASYEQLLSLPGIGPYTAGAIASIAFGLHYPAVDGNLLRVLARFLNDDGDVLRTEVKRRLTEAVAVMVAEARPGDVNQALMDLGSGVCVPGEPRCGACPLSAGCAAFWAGRAGVLPVRAPKKARRIEQITVYVVLHGDRVLLHKRPDGGLLGGLWEFPNAPAQSGMPEVLRGFACVGEDRLPDAKHIFTHVEWHMTGQVLRTGRAQSAPGCIWATLDELESRYALPSAFAVYTQCACDFLKK